MLVKKESFSRSVDNAADNSEVLKPPLRALVVEDSADICRLYIDLLQPEGFEVTVCVSGDAFMKRAGILKNPQTGKFEKTQPNEFDGQTPDVAFVDWKLPGGVDGLEVTELIKDEYGTGTRRIMVTANAYQLQNKFTPEQLLDFGVQQVIAKPFNINSIYVITDGIKQRRHHGFQKTA